jgi:hypothetical protein
VKGKLKGGRAWKIDMTVKHLFMSSLLAWFSDALGVKKKALLKYGLKTHRHLRVF